MSNDQALTTTTPESGAEVCELAGFIQDGHAFLQGNTDLPGAVASWTPHQIPNGAAHLPVYPPRELLASFGTLRDRL